MNPFPIAAGYYLATTSRLRLPFPHFKGSTYEGGNYCGPGWGFTKEDLESGRIQEMPGAIDSIDQACRIHDQCYADHGWFHVPCNVALTHNLVNVITNPDSTVQQRVDAALMSAVFMVEIIIWDYPRQVGSQLWSNAADSLDIVRARLRQAFESGRSMLEAIAEAVR